MLTMDPGYLLNATLITEQAGFVAWRHPCTSGFKHRMCNR